jgi:hypothetical protein
MRVLLLALFVCGEAAAAATASGRHWRLSVDAIACEAPVLTIATRIEFLGPAGAVEAPVIRLADDAGRRHLPKSLVWNAGPKPLSDWLAAGGLRKLEPGPLAEVQFRFEASGALWLEFGDIPAFAIARKGEGCEYVLKAAEIQAPRVARSAKPAAAIPVHRGRYPCTAGTTAAEYPPYLPRQLLVFGRGYLPAAREIELPMGRAPAQSYAYAGADELGAVEAAARSTIAADFPQYSSRHFGFNWGVQKAAGGNEVYAIGIYDLRSCPRK